MATLSVIGTSSTALIVQISGLEHPSDQYGGFRYGTYSSGIVSSESEGTSYVYTGLSSSTQYRLFAEAKWDGTWYFVGDTYGTTDSPPPPPTPQPPYNISVSVNGLNITVTFSMGANTNYSRIDYYWDGVNQNVVNVYGTSHSFSVPSYNTTYQFDMQGVTNEGQGSGWTTTISFNTGSPPTPDVPSSAPALSTRGVGSLDVTWGTSTGATSYTLRYAHYSGVYTEVQGLASASYTITGLEHGVLYCISVKGVNANGSSLYTSETAILTAPKPPTISAGTITGTSVQVNISGMTGNHDYVRVHYYNSSWQIIGYLDGQNGGSVNFTGLTTGALYYFQAWSYYSGIQSASYGEITITVNARPTNWSWSYNIYSGGPVYASGVSGTILKAYIMPATEWNNFTSKINEFRRFKGLPDYGSFPAIASESDCTPSVLSQAIYAVNAMGFSIPDVSAGNIAASTFIQLRDNLNSL